MKFLTVLLLAATLLGAKAHGATISEYRPAFFPLTSGGEHGLKSGYSDAVLISGEIMPGDAVRFGEYLKQRQRAKRAVAILFLDSPGEASGTP